MCVFVFILTHCGLLLLLVSGYPSLSSDTAQDSSSRFRFTVRTGVDAHA